MSQNRETLPRSDSCQTFIGEYALPLAKVLHDGWLHTGEAGMVDETGYLYVQDRIKDMIVSGGENVYPSVVENVLQQHPAVAEAAVIRVPDERWGEVVKAIAVLRAEATATADELIEFCRGSWPASSDRARWISRTGCRVHRPVKS